MSKTIVTVIRDARDCMEPVYRDCALRDLAKIVVSLVRLSGAKVVGVREADERGRYSHDSLERHRQMAYQQSADILENVHAAGSEQSNN